MIILNFFLKLPFPLTLASDPLLVYFDYFQDLSAVIFNRFLRHIIICLNDQFSFWSDRLFSDETRCRLISFFGFIRFELSIFSRNLLVLVKILVVPLVSHSTFSENFEYHTGLGIKNKEQQKFKKSLFIVKDVIDLDKRSGTFVIHQIACVSYALVPLTVFTLFIESLGKVISLSLN